MSIDRSRRSFLKRWSQTLGLLSISGTGLELLSGSILQKALAASTTSGMNYVMWYFPGGPPRWMFDLLLTPTGRTGSNFVAGNFGTVLDISRSSMHVDYAVNRHVVGGKDIYLPPVWKAGPRGQDFASLLPHTCFFRGVDMEINNHVLSARRQVGPVVGGESITGAVASRWMTTVAGVGASGLGPTLAFKSKRGAMPTMIDYSTRGNSNPIQHMLRPFLPHARGRVAHSSDQVKLQSQALMQFERQAQADGVETPVLVDMYESAMDLMDQNIYRLNEQWNEVYGRYNGLIEAALQSGNLSLPGLFDKAVRGSRTDVRLKFGPGPEDFASSADVRSGLRQGLRVGGLAENFAIAEISLGRFTNNLTLGVSGLSNVNFGRSIGIGHDQHAIGSVISTMSTTLVYRAFLAGLTEQVRNLKKNNLFDKTLLHIASEFNRTPLSTGSGSDHAPFASNSTIISGLIKQVAVIGNIQKASYSSTYPGTFGVAAGFNLAGETRPIQVNDVALTITSMLGVEPVVTNGRSLLVPKGQGWVPAKSEAKNV